MALATAPKLSLAESLRIAAEAGAAAPARRFQISRGRARA